MFSRKTGLLIVTTLALLAAASFVRIGQAQKPTSTKASPASHAKLAGKVAIVGRAVAFAETRPVRELMAQGDQVDRELEGENEEINELNTVFRRTPKVNAPLQRDGALQSSFGADGHFRLKIPTPSVVFEGLAANGSAPPDTMGAVGPNDYVQIVNATKVQIFDKAGVARGPAFSLNTLFAPLGPPASSNNNGDGLVLYDRMANRWILTQFAFVSSATPPFHQPIAVSKTSDPTGEYWAYDFITPGADFPDYGKIGSWPDGYYFSDRQFTNGVTYNGFGVFAFDRAKMLVGDSTASFIYFNAGPTLSDSSSGIIPTDYNGLTPPPAGAPNVFSVFLDDAFDTVDALRLFDFHADFAVPANSTFLERPESPLPVASFDSRSPGVLTGARNEIEEPSPATTADYLNAIGDRLMLRLQYFNRAGIETITTVQTVNAGIIPPPGQAPTIAEYRAATRWYVLQKTSPGGNWSVQDQGTYSPDATERWMGSSVVDNAGNLAVGYSTSSLSVFPSITYAGRLLGDPPGMLAQGEATLFAGSGVQLLTSNRWGDYSAMCLDPADDATFWYTNEFYDPTGQFLWRTKVGAFKFAGTTAPAQGTLSGTITACDTGAPLKDALVQVTGGPSTGFSAATKADGTYSMNLSPGSYSATIVDPAHNCNASGPFSVTITNGATTNLSQCLTGVARFVFSASAVSVDGGNGNGNIEPNECNNLDVTILNDGCLLGSGVSAVLSTTTPNVTVTQSNSPYPDIAENATGVNTTPFQVSTSAAFTCGTAIDFTLTVSFAGGSSVLNFSVPTCTTPPTVVNGSLDTSDPVQEGRLARNAVVSICGTAKVCPGIFGTGDRHYDVLTFPNGPGAACATITTTAPGGSTTQPILPVAYLNSYVPPGVGTEGNICINYLGDPGGSPNTVNSFAVDVPALATLVVVVEEVNAAQPPGSVYTVEVSGLVGAGVGPGPCDTGGGDLTLESSFSRKTGRSRSFDIPLPGVEDRSDNKRFVIGFTFNNNVTGADSASTSCGTIGNVRVDPNDAHTLLVTFNGQTCNAQNVTISLTNVHDDQGNTLASAETSGCFLIGDENGDGRVLNGDINRIQNHLGEKTDLRNFRADINADGRINNQDVQVAKAHRGESCP